MRRGALATTRALSEQATASDQISKETERLAKLIVSVSREMTEQAAGMTQISTSTEELKQQSEQTARAMKEQSRAVKDVTSSTQNVAKQIRLITAANQEHCVVAERLMTGLPQIGVVARLGSIDAGAQNGHARSSAEQLSAEKMSQAKAKSTSVGRGGKRANKRSGGAR